MLPNNYGIDNEKLAIQAYTDYQQHQGHPGLVVSPCGIFINTEFPFLGAMPDGSVYDPNELEQPYGYLEVKCPYSVRDRTPEEACSVSNFYCNLDSTRKLKLKETHQYFAQVQGQMAIGERMWCDLWYTHKKVLVLNEYGLIKYFGKMLWYLNDRLD